MKCLSAEIQYDDMDCPSGPYLFAYEWTDEELEIEEDIGIIFYFLDYKDEIEELMETGPGTEFHVLNWEDMGEIDITSNEYGLF